MSWQRTSLSWFSALFRVFSSRKKSSDDSAHENAAKPVSLRSARAAPPRSSRTFFTQVARPGPGAVGADVLDAPHNFRPYSCFTFPSRLLRPSRRLNTSRAAEERALARAYGVASQPSLRKLRFLRRIFRPYQYAPRQRLAGGGGGASSSILRVTLQKVRSEKDVVQSSLSPSGETF